VTKPRATGRRRREAIEAEVLAAVEKLMAEGHSYTEIPVQRIAEEAGIARSTFYVHFPDKAQLLIRMADIATQDLFRAAEGWWEGDHRTGPEGVAATMKKMIAGFREHDRVLLALMELAGYEPEVGRFWNDRVTAFIAVVRNRLDELALAGEVSPAIGTATTASVLTWMVERSIAQHVLEDPDGSGDAELAETLGRAIWLVTFGDAPAD
jgi:AcrR family transcriptional regulator